METTNNLSNKRTAIELANDLLNKFKANAKLDNYQWLRLEVTIKSNELQTIKHTLKLLKEHYGIDGTNWGVYVNLKLYTRR